MNFIVSSDSCLDELKDKAISENIKVIPMTFIAGDETYKDDFSSLDEYKHFYEEISSGKVFKTASLNSVEVEEHFEKLLAEGKDVIHVSLSSGLSVTYNVVKEVADRLNQKNKNKVYALDSLSATQGQNLLVKLAIEYGKQNMAAHEVFERLKNVVNHLDVTFYVTDFDCLKRGGRVSGVQAAIGKFVGIRPVLDIDTEGKLRVVSKVIGTKKALIALAAHLSNYDNEANVPVYIAHTGNMDAVEEMTKLILEKLPEVKIVTNYIGPTIGSHTGFGTLGLVFLGKGERKWVMIFMANLKEKAL